MTVKTLIEKYEAQRAYYLTSKYNETLLRSDFLDPFFELLGWDIKNHTGKSTNEREVILEEALKGNLSEHSKKPDYTFRLFSERKYFLEAKKPSVSIETNNETAKQVRRYGFTAKLKISALSNFEYLLIYDTSIKVEQDDTFHKALIKKYHYTEYENKFEEIKKLLGRDSVYTGEFDVEWKDIEEKINLFSIDTLFLSQINEWRKLLGAEIYKCSSSIDEQELNDIVQSYLNRILFLRVCEDRNLETYQTLLQLANTNDFAALIKKFEEADKRYNSGLFDQILKDKIIENISSVFWTIIKQLYYPESTYSFAVFSSDILGNIYEIFLSEKLIIIDDEVVLVKKPENIDRDIITTPTYIISDILRSTVIPKCNGKTAQEILKLKFSDISCGSGAFLLELFQLLNDILVDYYLRTDNTQLIQTAINTYKLPFKIKRELLLNVIYGIDKDFNAVEATKFGLLLKLLEGENINSTTTSKPVLPDLSQNIYFGNSLLNSQQVSKNKSTEINQINPFDFGNLKFDVIVGNPPYMKSEDMKNITPFELPLYKTLYDSAYKQFDKYFLFIEQGLNLLTDDGTLGYIVPSKFTKVGAGQKIRELLTQKGYLHSIISFGANQVFSDKTTYTCILILEKQYQKTFRYTEIKNLKDWRLRNVNPEELQTEYTKNFSGDVWLLLPDKLKNVLNKIVKQSSTLSNIVGDSNIFNGIQTSATDIYIHKPLNEDDNYYYFEKDSKVWKVEKELTRPYYQTSNTDSLYTYRPFKANSFVIYPYKNINNVIEFVPLKDLETNYPFLFNYLINNKERLVKRNILPTPKTDEEWYRFGRHQSLDKCEVDAKIVVGILSQNDSYAIDYGKTVLSSGGNAGYGIISVDTNCQYSIYYIQAILNSKYVEWYCALIGSVFRGGYISHGTQVLKKLPIRTINFSDKGEKEQYEKIVELQKELIAIYSKIDEKKGNKRELIPLERQFEAKKQNLESLISKLYDLESEDSLIPLIKDMYEVN